jgi:hypothetical protein
MIKTNSKFLISLFLCTAVIWLCIDVVSLYAANEFNPKISVAVGYDDNIRLRKDPKSDFFTQLTGAIDYIQGRPQNQIKATGKLEYELYNRFSEYSGIRMGSLDFEYHYEPTSRWSLDAKNQFTLSYDPIDQNLDGNLNQVISDSEQRIRNVASFEGNYRFGPRGMIGGRYTYGINRIDRNSSTTTNNDSNYHKAEFFGIYGINQRYRLESLVLLQRTNFEEETDNDKGQAEIKLARMMGPQEEVYLSLGADLVRTTEDSDFQRTARDYNMYTAKIGYDTQFTRHFSLKSYAGVSIIDGDDKFNKAAGDLHPVARVELTYAKQHWELSSYGEYRFVEYDTLGYDSGLTASLKAGLGLRWDIAQFWKLQANIDYLQNDFQQGNIDNALSANGDTESLRVGGVVTYQLSKLWELSLDYRYLNNNNENDMGDLTQNRVFLMLTAEFPQRW